MSKAGSIGTRIRADKKRMFTDFSEKSVNIRLHPIKFAF